MKLHMQTPHESRMCSIDFEVQRSRSQCINYWKWFPAHKLLSLYTYHHETSHADLPWGKDVPYWFQGQRVKGQGHSALLSGNGFLCITAFPLHPWSQNFTGTLLLSQGCALLISGSKGQRSRSQCINYWKWLLAHNCYPFIPMVTKLHRQSLHGSRMCPIDFRVKSS